MKRDFPNLYIGGRWIAPVRPAAVDVVNPATEEAVARVAMGAAADVDRAVAAAAAAVEGWATRPPAERADALDRLITIYARRRGEMAEAITQEMGAPHDLAHGAQTGVGMSHLRSFATLARSHGFAHRLPDAPDADMILHEAIGVAGLITPWNWPMNQIAQKVGAALAAGCAMVLKPSEMAPLSALLFAEMVDEAGLPPGVFNLVNGDGPEVGEALARHTDVAMVSLTGSGRAGEAVTRAAAPTVKRVVLELGGKGANLIFADAELEASVRRGVQAAFANSGQSCNAPTRMLVEASVYSKAVEIAAEAANATRMGDPASPGPHLGPLSSARQFERVRGYIRDGAASGSRLVAGGDSRPDGVNRGYFVKPTVFADVDPDARIAQEEIFGPVLCMTPFADEAEGVRLANATPYGLTNHIQTVDPERARRVARRLRSGMVVVNHAPRSPGSPFGGMKQSGNGREGGRWGLEEFLEVKSVSGWPAS